MNEGNQMIKVSIAPFEAEGMMPGGLPLNRADLMDASHVCGLCEETFSSFRTLKRHMKCHDLPNLELKSGQLKSENDSVTTSTEQDKIKVVQVTSEKVSRSIPKKKPEVSTRVQKQKQKHICHDCGKSFAQLSKLKQHLPVHTGEKAFQCSECGNRFQNGANLAKHMQRHSGKRPHVCKVCGKGFKTKDDHNVHTKIHTGKRPFTCQHCGKSFAQAYYLKYHENRVHGNEKWPVYGKGPYTAKKDWQVCIECGKMCPNSTSLRCHMRVHTGEKPYTCKVCGKSFSQSTTLKYHQSVHTTVRDHNCQECGKGFTRKEYLNNHMKLHTGEKPFTCQFCEKSFLTQGKLNVHMRRHTQEVTFPCEECGKIFYIQSSLRSHMIVHTGERPFECDECGKRCTTKSNLRVHKVVHSDEKPYPCPQCGRFFARVGNVKKHMKTHENENTKEVKITKTVSRYRRERTTQQLSPTTDDEY